MRQDPIWPISARAVATPTRSKASGAMVVIN